MLLSVKHSDTKTEDGNPELRLPSVSRISTTLKLNINDNLPITAFPKYLNSISSPMH